MLKFKTWTYEEKEIARAEFNKAKRNGIMVVPKTCEDCEDSSCKITAHHEDYSKPLDVKWVCWDCHGKYHSHELKFWDKDALEFCNNTIVESSSFNISVELKTWLDDYAENKNVSPSMILNYAVYRFMKSKDRRY